MVSPGDTGITQARAKTDRLDARTLARLLWLGELDSVWVPDELTRMLRRRLARREQLMRARTRTKNEVHAILMRQLVGRPPFADLFGVKGRAWLRQLELPIEECETVEACMRHIEFLDAEIAEVERLIARYALSCSEARRLMSVPCVNVICAATFLAAIGDIRRFTTSRQLVGYLGLDPKVRQSGSSPAKGGRISKQGSPQPRWHWSRPRSAPCASPDRCTRSTSGSAPAAVTGSRPWLEITAGAKKYTKAAAGIWTVNEKMREAERELARQAEASYVRMVQDWHASAPNNRVGASVTPERA